MFSVYISQMDKTTTDYDRLFKKLDLKGGSYQVIGVTHTINFKCRSIKPVIILVNGSELLQFKGADDFINFFKKGNSEKSPDQGKTELHWLKEKLERIVEKVDNKLLSQLSNEKKANLLIHWGGPGRKEASTRLRDVAREMDFPFNIADFSSLEKEDYDKLVNGDLAAIQEAEKSLLEKSAEVNRRIYEFMETVLLKNSDKYLKSLKENKIEPFVFVDKKMYQEAKWIIEELKYFLQKASYIKDDLKKQEILAFFEDRNKFHSVLSLKPEPAIEIKDIKKFRRVFNEFLALFPEDIYPQES